MVTIQLTETEHKLLVDMLERESAHVCEGFCRKVEIGTSETLTLCGLRSQGVKLFRRRLEGSPRAGQLSFANRMQDFNTRNRTAGRPKGLKAQHRTREPLYRAMILLHEIIGRLAVTHSDGRLMRLVVARKGLPHSLHSDQW